MNDESAGRPTFGYFGPDTDVEVTPADESAALGRLYAEGLVPVDVALEACRVRYGQGCLDGIQAGIRVWGRMSLWELLRTWWSIRKEARAPVPEAPAVPPPRSGRILPASRS